jgi:hypothetical protein
MKAKTLGILAAITIIVIGVAVFLNQETTKPLSQGRGLVFPGLMAKINEVTEFTIESTGETVTLVRQENSWGVKEKDHYPAALDKVKSSLVGMAELRFREPKTNNPDLYEKLGLQDHTREGSRATLVTIRANQNQEAAKLLIGDQRPAKGNPSLSEIYVRKPDDPQTWLVTGKLALERTVTEWLDQDLLALAATRVHRVRVRHPGGESLTVEKTSPDALDFQIADMPKGYKVQSQFNVNNVVTTLSNLTLDDVIKEEAIESEGKAGVKAVLETFDGLQVTVQALVEGEKVYGKVAAEFDPSLVYKVEEPESKVEKEDQSQDKKAETANTEPSTEEKSAETGGAKDQDQKTSEPAKPKMKPAEEVKEEVTAMNKKFGGWVFELPKFKVDNFSKKKEDLIAKES